MQLGEYAKRQEKKCINKLNKELEELFHEYALWCVMNIDKANDNLKHAKVVEFGAEAKKLTEKIAADFMDDLEEDNNTYGGE